MAVLIEGISVVIRADRLLAAFGNDWEAFKAVVPNKTLCADSEIARVGFMAPADVKQFIDDLTDVGLTYIVDGIAQDLVVVDQQRGPLVQCDWIEFGYVSLGGDTKKRIATCRLIGSIEHVVVTPEGWRFEESLSSSFGFAPDPHLNKGLTFIHHQDGLDVYRNLLSGTEVFIGRTTRRPG